MNNQTSFTKASKLTEKQIKTLHLARSVRAHKFHQLHIKYNHSIDQIFQNIEKEKITLINKNILNHEIEEVYKNNVQLIFFGDESYPESLKHIYSPPATLSALGNIELLKKPCLAVIGSRQASIASLHFTKGIVKDLAMSGQVIVSGLAAGIDTQAHKTSLETGTIAVLGCGINVIYPSENEELYNQIQNKGLIISEFGFNYPVKRESFPERNRIISGLSWGVLVIEAALKSGSLITAKHAIAQGKEIFAVPGHPLDSHSHGCNSLLKDGAILTQTADDILLNFRQNINDTNLFDEEVYEEESVIDENAIENHILSKISHTPIFIDKIAREINCSIQQLRNCLIKLELEGEIMINSNDTICKMP